MGELNQLKVIGGASGESFFTTKFDALLAWSRKWSLFQYPFATACCGMEFFQVAGPRYDVARFGAEGQTLAWLAELTPAAALASIATAVVAVLVARPE